MAIEAIEVYPTCEIHLIRSNPTPMSVIVREAKQGFEKNLLHAPGCLVEELEFEPTLVDVDIDHGAGVVTFTPTGNTPGNTTTIGRIRNTYGEGDNAIVTEVLVRVFVHDDIDQYWIGNKGVTIHEGADNYVLSVYATFNDTTTPVDISSHSYVNFSSADPSKITIDDHQDKGRITGVAQTHNTPVSLQVQIGAGPVREVAAHVIEPLNTPKPILRCISGSAQVENRENLLFIAEGFTASQKDIFETLVHQVSDQLLNHRNNSPYNLLKDKFNIWIAFEPSPQEGASIMRPVDLNSGELFKVGIDNDPFLQNDYALLQVPDNKYGISCGYRHGDQISRPIDVNDPPDRDLWYIPQGTIYPRLDLDRRRLTRNWLRGPAYNNYLNTLQVDTDLHPGEQYADLSNVWKFGGRNHRMVCWLVNDDLGGTAKNHSDIGITASVKSYTNLKLAPSPGLPGVPSYRHIPRLLGVKRSITLSNLYLEVTKAKIQGAQPSAVAALVAHELSHAFGLGDEYETGPKTTLVEGDTEKEGVINYYPNLTHYGRVRDNNNSNTQIDLSKVVWNRWHRVDMSATLTTQAINTGNTIRLEVHPMDALAWDIKFGQLDQQLFLRTRDINFDYENDENSHKYFEGPFTLNNIDIITGEILLTGSLNRDFPSGSILYKPKEIDGHLVTLIHPKVVAFFNDPGGNNKAPFADKKGVCNTPNLGPPVIPVIPGFSVNNWQYIVGVYEGGKGYNCKVYRPSGQSRMRYARKIYDDVTPLVFHAFCPVSKYYLVNKIDPSKLGDIDKEYPA